MSLAEGDSDLPPEDAGQTPRELAEQFVRELPAERRKWDSGAFIALTELAAADPALVRALSRSQLTINVLQHEMVRRAILSPEVIGECLDLDLLQVASAHCTVVDVIDADGPSGMTVGIVLTNGLDRDLSVFANERMSNRWSFVVERLVALPVSDPETVALLHRLLGTSLLDALPIPLLGVAMPELERTAMSRRRRRLERS